MEILGADIFSIIQKNRFPVNKGKMSIYEFLEKKYQIFFDDLKHVDTNSFQYLDAEFYKLLSSKSNLITETCDEILRTILFFNEGNIHDYIECFDNLMETIKPDLLSKGFNENNILSPQSAISARLFRMRPYKKDVYDRKDLFHIPYAKRHLIKRYRYSIEGYPSLYLSTSIPLCWFECGMPKKFYVSEFILKPKVKSININKFITFIDSPLSFARENRNNGIVNKNEVFIKYLITYPLRLACSLSVIDKSSSFIEEYIIPNLLMSWIRNNDEYIGVCYSSSSAIIKAQKWNGFNIAIPAKNINDNYCKYLKDLFKVSKPFYIDIRYYFCEMENEYNEIKEFTKRMKTELQNGEVAHSLYQKITSLCEQFLLIYDTITTVRRDYPEEVLHMMLITLSNYADLIHSAYKGNLPDGLKEIEIGLGSRTSQNVIDGYLGDYNNKMRDFLKIAEKLQDFSAYEKYFKLPKNQKFKYIR